MLTMQNDEYLEQRNENQETIPCTEYNSLVRLESQMESPDVFDYQSQTSLNSAKNSMIMGQTVNFDQHVLTIGNENDQIAQKILQISELFV